MMHDGPKCFWRTQDDRDVKGGKNRKNSGDRFDDIPKGLLAETNAELKIHSLGGAES
jgi:hypothetical protein